MKKLVKKICIVLSSILCIMQTQTITASTAPTLSATWPKGPAKSSLAAESALLMEASTGTVLYSKNADKRQYPASITKIMTALVAIENSSLDEVVVFSKNAVFGIEPGSSHIAVDVGEKLTMRDCLYAMLLESANEVCLGVAEHVAGSVEAFVDMMNKKAGKLGCTNTHFVNPNGLHNDKHYTTAHDMGLIAKAAIANKTFAKVTGTKQHTIPKTNKKAPRTWIKNHHQMLYGYKYPKYEWKNCIGGKTGYTTKAHSTLVTFAKKNNITLISVVLKDYGPAYEQNEYIDSKSLFDYGFKKFSLYDITEIEDNVATTNLFTKYPGLLHEEKPLIYIKPGTKIIFPKNVSHQDIERNIAYNNNDLKQGENIIGTVKYSYANHYLSTGTIIYKVTDLDKLKSNPIESNSPKLGSKKTTTLTNTIAFCIAIVIIVIGCIYYIFVVNKRRKKHSYYD